MPDESETLGEFVKRNFDEIKDMTVHELRVFMDGVGWGEVGTKAIWTIIKCHKGTGYLDD